MSASADDSDNLSPRAAAFSIASLLTKDFNENSNTRETSEVNPPSVDHKEKGNWWNGCQNDRLAQKAKICAVSRDVYEDHSIQNILNGEQTRGEKCGDGKRRGLTRSTSILDPLQQFAACCDLVRNLDSLKNTASYSQPQMRVMEVQREVQVAMQQSDLWWKFYACGTEMVITRTGRWEKILSNTMYDKSSQTSFRNWSDFTGIKGKHLEKWLFEKSLQMFMNHLSWKTNLLKFVIMFLETPVKITQIIRNEMLLNS